MYIVRTISQPVEKVGIWSIRANTCRDLLVVAKHRPGALSMEKNFVST
jgi:hypothetical protein